MKKVIRLNENDIESLVKKIMNEDMPERESRRKQDRYSKRNFEPYPREEDVISLFGKYGDDIPPQVIEYLRKNPESIVKRLVKIYGEEKILSYM